MRFRLITASVLCLIVSSVAFALTVEHKVTAEYVRSNSSDVAVKVTEGKNGLLQFKVDLTLKNPQYVVAHLAVRGPNGTLVESDTPAFTRNTKNTFHFAIPREYVATSEFSVSKSHFTESGGEAVPIPGTVIYQLQLTEFVPDKQLGPVK